MIRSYVQDHPKEWDVHLPLLTAAYIGTVHPATKFTPNYLMLGREVIRPVDLTFSSAVTSNSSIPEYSSLGTEKTGTDPEFYNTNQIQLLDVINHYLFSVMVF